MKLDPTKEYYDEEFGWVGHSASLHSKSTDAQKELVARRYELDIIGGIRDKEASYSYDDWALVKLDNKYYMLSTSGCSCPSPTETWRIEKGPATLEEIKEHILTGQYEGYTMPKKQVDDFLALFKLAEKA